MREGSSPERPRQAQPGLGALALEPGPKGHANLSGTGYGISANLKASETRCYAEDLECCLLGLRRRIAVTNSARRRASRHSHSQISSTCHPLSDSFFRLRMSRARLPAIFVRQYPVLDLTARFPSTHFSHPCQKQPWTKTASLRLAKTISGRPGSCRSWSR